VLLPAGVPQVEDLLLLLRLFAAVGAVSRAVSVPPAAVWGVENALRGRSLVLGSGSLLHPSSGGSGRGVERFGSVGRVLKLHLSLYSADALLQAN